MSRRLVGHIRFIPSLNVEKSFHAHQFGLCLWIDKGLKPLLLVRTVLPIAKRGWIGSPTAAQRAKAQEEEEW